MRVRANRPLKSQTHEHFSTDQEPYRGMYNLLFWTSIHVLLLWTLTRVTRAHRERRTYKLIFVLPLLLEGLHRLVASFLSAGKIEEIAFFEDGKPFMKQGASRIPYVGGCLFVLIWLASLYLSFRYWALGTPGFAPLAVTLPHVNPGEVAGFVVQIDARGYFGGIGDFFAATDWTSWQVWLLLYSTVGLFPFLALDSRLVRYSALVIAAFAIGTAVLILLGAHVSLDWWVLPEFFRVYSLYVTLLAFTLLGHLLVSLVRGSTSSRSESRSRARSKGSQRREPQKA